MSTTIESLRAELAQLPDHAPHGHLTNEERVERAKAVMLGRTEASHAMYLETCIHCGMCAEACHFFRGTGDARYTPIYKVEPLRKVYRREAGPMRWLYRMFTRDVTVHELNDWQELAFDACTECGRCDLMCPLGIQISPMIHIMREALVAAECAPKELLAVRADQRATGKVLGVGKSELEDLVAKIRAKGIEVPVDKPKAEVLYLATALDLKLFPSSLENAAKIFNRAGVDWTLLSASIQLLGTGESGGELDARRITQEAGQRGAKTVVLPECGHSYPALRYEAPNVGGKALPYAVASVSEFVGRLIADKKIKVRPVEGKPKVTFHDPCKQGRHGGVFDEPRAALAALGVELVEMESHERTNYCCGGGGGQFLLQGKKARELRGRAFEIKMREVDDTGASAVVTSCNSCRYNYTAGAIDHNWRTPVRSLVELVGTHLAD